MTIAPRRWETLVTRQHFALVIVLAWLILTSPWVSMLRRIPSRAGFFVYAHVALGFVALVLAITYTLSCARGDRWRLYFPWAAGRLGTVGSDIAGLLHGKVPAAEGGGLFAMIEGLLLLALLVTALTGAVWFFTQGSATAATARGYHVMASHWLIGLIVAHLLAVASHLLDFVREG